MKIWKIEQLKQQPNVDAMVKAKAEEILKVLNVHYGDERLVTDLGGYVLLDVEEIHTFINQYPSLIPEYIESFEGQDLNQYVEALFMLSSDDHVVIYLLKEILDRDYPILVEQYETLAGGY